MADIIVYRQEELDKALADGIKSITLCAGVFTIPKTHNVTFDRIGPVRAEVLCSKPEADAAGMVFINTYPVYKSAYALAARASLAVVAAVSSGSFYGSGSGSFIAGSGSGGSGSHFHEYEYEYELGYGGSYVTSLSGSYSLSFAASYALSYAGSYSLASSGSYSLSVPYSVPGSFGVCAAVVSDGEDKKTIRVFGYGINLI